MLYLLISRLRNTGTGYVMRSHMMYTEQILREKRHI